MGKTALRTQGTGAAIATRPAFGRNDRDR